MKKLKLPDGRLIEPFQPFMFDSIQYPGNWAELASESEISELGFERVHESNAEIVSHQVPESVSRFKALAALLQAGLLADVEAYMALPETDPFTVLAWKEAQEFRRDSPIVSELAQVLSLTEVQLDDLFSFASTITG